MVLFESTLLVLLLIIGVGLLIPEIFRRKIPFVTVIILIGAAVGPHGFDLVRVDSTLEFFGFLGVTFLMLMAGIETNTAKLRDSKRELFWMTLLNAIFPFLVGMAIPLYFGYSLLPSLLIGIVFISSSVAMIIPSLEQCKMIERRFGQMVLAAVMIADILSLLLLSVVLQTKDRIANLPLPLHYLVLLLSIIILLKLIPKISDYGLHKRFSAHTGNERRVRFVLLIIIAAVAIFSLLGVHPILAAFLVGLSLSGVIATKDGDNELYSKIHTLGYGLFIPVFFFIVGLDLDLTILSKLGPTNMIMIWLVLGALVTKILSGYVAGLKVGFTTRDSWTYGFLSVSKLTTALAVTYTAQSLGILDSVLTTSIILVAVITTLLGPIAVKFIHRKVC